MATAKELKQYLAGTGTGKNKLKAIDAVVKQNQAATAEDGFAALEELCGPPRPNDRPYPERLNCPVTLQKAQEFVESHRKREQKPAAPSAGDKAAK